MNFSKFNLFTLAILALVVTLSSCKKKEEVTVTPLTEGNSVTVRNTYQDNTVEEISFASFLKLPVDGLDKTATVSNNTVEFENTLFVDLTSGGGPLINGLYDIDLKTNSITYTLLPKADDPFWSTNYRTLEAGVRDRYYMTFENPHNITGFTASDPAINLRIDSDKVIVVEVREGFVFQPGAAFTITLK